MVVMKSISKRRAVAANLIHQGGALVKQDIDVAVIGAGPHGLSATIHLKRAGVAAQAFGEPMSFSAEHADRNEAPLEHERDEHGRAGRSVLACELHE